MKFVSGTEKLSNDFIIMVVYNGINEEDNMLPTANTCIATIHVTRYFLTYNSLKKSVIVYLDAW